MPRLPEIESKLNAIYENECPANSNDFIFIVPDSDDSTSPAAEIFCQQGINKVVMLFDELNCGKDIDTFPGDDKDQFPKLIIKSKTALNIFMAAIQRKLENALKIDDRSRYNFFAYDKKDTDIKAFEKLYTSTSTPETLGYLPEDIACVFGFEPELVTKLAKGNLHTIVITAIDEKAAMNIKQKIEDKLQAVNHRTYGPLIAFQKSLEGASEIKLCLIASQHLKEEVISNQQRADRKIP